jgi:serine phosphatase RsbU (regulator of sigma subunit)
LLDKGLAIALRTKNLNVQKLAYENLSKAYEQKKDIPKAYDFYRKFITVKDTMFSQESTGEITRKQMEYEFSKKQEEEKAEQEKKDLVEKEEANRQAVVRYVIIAGFVLLLITVGFVFRSYRRKQASHKLLEIHRAEIEEQKKEIQDSIQYAQLIQRALLPVPAEIEANFREIFGLYKPKDVVSGDFYWFNRTAAHIYIAAADCTGHGVPGAFMSSIGSEKLTEAVSDSGFTAPAVILGHLNRGVKAALRQNEPGSRSRDGMDIALLRFDTGKTEAVYAGANRPLWLIRNGELIEYKPTKSPIGGSIPDDTHYEEHRIDLRTDDRLYIFTDGFSDQFGGPQEKKFMTAKFRELLLSIHQLPMPEQEKELEKAYLAWKGNFSQTDDVLVIGIRV